jgi:uncharacterized protein YbjT (DUF2867 family)
MKVFLTGSTGYVGRQIARDLVSPINGGKAAHTVRVLVRPESVSKIPRDLAGRAEVVYGDTTSADSLRGKLHGCDAVINLPGLLREFPKRGITFEKVHFEGTKNLVDEAKRAGVRRFLQMSALGVRAGAATGYQKTKWMAEEYLRASGLEWTIFRPSVIFGREGEGLMNFVSVLVDLHQMMPFFVPVIGNGEYRFQPVAIENVSEGFVKSLTTQASIGKVYEVGGPEKFTYNEMLDLVGEAIGKKKAKLHQPVFLMKFLASLLGGFEFFPISKDQITMLLEENICTDERPFYRDFQIKPIYFRDGLTRYLRKP